jgi:hypothetical protein
VVLCARFVVGVYYYAVGRCYYVKRKTDYCVVLINGMGLWIAAVSYRLQAHTC